MADRRHSDISYKDLYLPKFAKIDLPDLKNLHQDIKQIITEEFNTESGNVTSFPDISSSVSCAKMHTNIFRTGSILDLKNLHFNDTPMIVNKNKSQISIFNNKPMQYVVENNNEDGDPKLNESSDENKFDKIGSETIGHQIVIQLSGLDDIAGLEDVKQSLREAIVYPMKYPQLFTNGRTVWSRALLYGVPGVGKTAIAHAISAEANLPLYQVTSADLTSPWIGQTEKLVRKLFQHLGQMRCILFLDEIDSMCKMRSADDSSHCRRMSTELLIQIQNFEGSAMFILCATNRPWEIDPAFLRRFEKRIYVPLPDIDAREKLILNNIDNDLSGSDTWKDFLKSTDGLTGSDIKTMVRTAMMIPLHEMQTASYWIETEEGKLVPSQKDNVKSIKCSLNNIPNWKVWCRSLKMEDLWNALKNVDKTVTEKDLQQFSDFKKEHAVK